MKLIDVVLEDFNKFKEQSDDLATSLRDTYNRDDIFVNIGQYSGRDKGYGKVTFQVRDELPTSEWTNIKNFLSAKGYEITDDSNYYECDDDRCWYPTFKFEFNVE